MAIVAMLLAAGSATPLLAQQAPDSPATVQAQPAPPRPAAFSGRRLDGARLPVPVVDGVIELEGARAWMWTEPEHAEGSVDAIARTQRIMLAGNVRVRLGTHAIVARRAAIWLAPLPEDDPEAAPGVWQVFAYLDEARTIEGGTVSVSGPRVPIRAILRTPGRDGAGPDLPGVRLRADLVKTARPDDPFVIEAEAALAERLARLTAAPTAQPPMPGVAQVQRELPPVDWPQPIFAAEGILTVTPGETIRMVPGDEERALITSGGVHINYWDRQRNSTLQLSAQRAVVFLDPGPLTEMAQFDIGRVRGFYLEGDVVATDGEYTARAPRVYYDVRENRAILLDAVFWAYDQPRGMPLYLRADALRQLSANRFRAESAMLTNTAFFDPDLAIGLSSVTLTRKPSSEGTRNHIDARNITLWAGSVPFFYWPILRGEPDAIPLRGLGFQTSRNTGTGVQTSWDLYSLVGIDAPQGHDATLLADWYSLRGPAFGLNYRWSHLPDSQGNLFAYVLPSDQGEDWLVSGRSQPAESTRGLVMMEHRADLDDRWTLFAEAAYISDPTFMHAFFPHERWARERREITNAVRLQRVEDATLLSFEARARGQDFLVNQYLIQTPGYSVDKLPEVMYFRAADDVLPQWPGLLTWTHEYRAGVLRMNFHEPTARELGFAAPFRSQAFWGIGPDESPADVLRARGLHEDPVMRFDTRHELNMPLKAGPLNITPFLVGRATFYDQDFDTFSTETNDPYRLWGAAGLSLSTELVHINNSISSRLLDLHRIRHIVRPNVTLWHGVSTLDREHLPIFDADVEDLTDGSAVRFGIDQVWQTQRGGPGRWRSVDFFRLNTELVVSSGEVVRKSPIPRFFEFRPEYGNLGGTFGSIEAAWQVTEIVGLGAEAIYDFEIERIARTTIGATIEHTPDFSIFAEIRYLNAQDQTYANLGTRYNLTQKYSVALATSYDTDRSEFGGFSADIQRRFPNVVLGITVIYNNITEDTTFGLLFQPLGAGVPAARLRGAGGAIPDTGGIGAGRR